MANLTAKFRMVDEMSDRLGAIANQGNELLSSWEQIGSTANSSFSTATASVDGVATSLENVRSSALDAVASTEYWTEALGGYDKSALEALYSTEELVEMGLKSADALAEQNEMFELCEKSADQLTKSMEAARSIEEQFYASSKQAADISDAVTKADSISADAKEVLMNAQREASAAMEEFQRVQEAAAIAMADYESVLESGTTDINELEAAAEKAGHAAEDLAEANQRVTNAAGALSDASREAGEELDKAGNKGAESMQELESVIAAAGVTSMLKEMAEGAYELADAFSEAEKTIVLATGATGEALNSLEASMMNVYAHAKSADLPTTASAVGEINTRLNLTGDKLEEVTDLFIDYSNVTGQNVVSSVRSVTQIMNQWDVELDRLPELLDKLTYAGQISGISVESLSDTLVTNKGVLESLNFSLDTSIGLFAELELQGVSTQTAMTGFRSAVNKFADAGEDAGEAFKELINDIKYAGSESEATAISVDYFGSRAGTALASSIRNGQLSIDDFTSSLAEADGTLETTASTAQTLSEKWQSAGNNMKSAFTNALQPTIDDASSKLAEITDGAAEFLNKYPVVVKGITAITAGVATFTAAVAGYTVATKAAQVAQKALNAVQLANPYYLAGAAIAAVTVALTAFAVSAIKASDETTGMTAATREQYNELQALRGEYERACETYGETSEEAARLCYRVNDLEDAFEANRKTVEEFSAECDELIQGTQRVIDAYYDTGAEISNNELKTYSLIQKLEDLSTQNIQTAYTENLMKSVIEEINELLPDLSLSYDDVTSNVMSYTEAMRAAAKQKAEADMRTNEINAYSDAIAEQANLIEKIKEAEAELDAERKRHGMEKMPGSDLFSNGSFFEDSFWTQWITDIDEYKEKLDGLQSELAEVNAVINECEAAWQEAEEAAEEAAKAPRTYSEAVRELMSGVQGEIDELCADYDKARETARKSIDAQIGLFDEMSVKAEKSIDELQGALESQLIYLNAYTENLQKALDLGVDEALVEQLSDGSTESAAYLDTIISKVEELGSSTDAAKSFVDEFNAKFQEVEKAKETFSEKVGDIETDFTKKLGDLETKLEEAIDDMTMETEAAEAAKATMKGYVDEIVAGGDSAAEAAKTAAAKVRDALSAYDTSPLNRSDDLSATISNNTVNDAFLKSTETGAVEDLFNFFTLSRINGAYALGTDYASAGLKLVGENGPELVEFGGGERVYTADETEDIFARSTAKEFYVEPGKDIEKRTSANDADIRKTIRLEIDGSGAIEVSGNRGADRETILDVLSEHLKPVLMGIIQSEIYEEGELSYDF